MCSQNQTKITQKLSLKITSKNYEKVHPVSKRSKRLVASYVSGSKLSPEFDVSVGVGVTVGVTVGDGVGVGSGVGSGVGAGGVGAGVPQT